MSTTQIVTQNPVVAVLKVMLAVLLVSTIVSAQIVVEQNANADELATQLVVANSGLTVTSATFTGADQAAGTFTAGPFSIADGVILSSGDVLDAPPPDDSDGVTTDFGTPGSAECDSILGPQFTSFDAATLNITFDVDENTNSISFRFIFGSDEFPEFAGFEFTDIFGAFLNGNEISIDDSIAFITINSPFFADDTVALPPDNGLEYDGSTAVLQIQAAVTPGSVGNTLSLVICDGGDGTVDSAVLLASLRGMRSVTGDPLVGFPPAIGDPGDFDVETGDNVNFAVSASGTNDVTMAVDGLPTGATTDPVLPSTGATVDATFDWTPDDNQTGIFDVTFSATDAVNGLVDETTVSIDVAAGVVVTDKRRPQCKIAGFEDGPPRTMIVKFHDSESGIATIEVVNSENAEVFMPKFTVGTNDTLVVTSNKINPDSAAVLVLKVTDVAGNSRMCQKGVRENSVVNNDGFDMQQNFPNPFNPTTLITYKVPQTLEGVANVSMKIYDITGRLVKVLVNESKTAGTYTVQWDGTSINGQKVAAGVYIYRMVSGHYVTTKRMTYLK